MSTLAPPKELPLALRIAVGAATVAVATALAWRFDNRLEDVVLFFVLGIVTTAVRFGYAASLTATVLSVVALDYFFTRPYFSFAVYDSRNYLTFAIMAAVALVISEQTRRARREAATRVTLAIERARLAEEAQSAQLEAKDERLRNALLSSVSHDLRTPLAVIQGAADALRADPKIAEPGRAREHVETIVDEVNRLARLLRNLLDMTRLEAGTLRARKDWYPIEEVIGAALRRMETQLDQRPLDVRIAPDVSMAQLDATLIEQVLTNLLENAVKYSPPESPIAIAASRTAEGVVVDVSDSGPGIPEGEAESIFDKFYRASSTGIGMGLGLTICRGMLAAHDGRIWATNRPEGGASIRFVIPGAPPPGLPSTHDA